MRIYVQDYADKRKPYRLTQNITYTTRYHKNVTIKQGMRSDGATGSFDINSKSWWIHDQLCNTGLFDDGTKCTNLQASTIIYDILRDEGRWFRARSWFVATLFFGGGKARDNGMFNL